MRDELQIRVDFFRPDGICAENDNILLRAIQPSDEEDYINICKKREGLKKLFSDPSSNLREFLWLNLNSPADLNTIIIRKSDHAFCGYTGLQSFAELDAPELSIELAEKYQRQGIGTMALQLIMSRFTEVTGSKEFISKVRPENLVSQRLMRKLGGKPAGVAPFPEIPESVLRSMEDSEEEQPENIEELAREFDSTPRQLRSHVLVFKFSADN